MRGSPYDREVRRVYGGLRPPRRDTYARFEGNAYGLTGEEFGMALHAWALEVKGRDGRACRACGRQGSITAHHIRKAPEEALDISNGITLCFSCSRAASRQVVAA